MGARRSQDSRDGRSSGVVSRQLEGLLRNRRGAVWLSVGEVVCGGEEEFGVGISRRPWGGRRSEARRAGLGARSRGLLEVGQSARLGAVCSTISLDLLVTGQAEGMGPEVECHREGVECARVE